MLKGEGYIEFFPRIIDGEMTIKDNCWCLLQIEKDFSAYYRWHHYKNTFINLQTPKWDCHVSLIRKERVYETFKSNYLKYQHKKVIFEYDNIIHTNGEYYWIKCFSQDFVNLRKDMGLSEYPEFNYHITLGKNKYI